MTTPLSKLCGRRAPAGTRRRRRLSDERDPSGIARLLLAEHGLLERLRDGEPDLLARRNLDRLARLRVATHARLHLAEPENPEAGDLHVLALLDALRDRIDQGVQELVDLLAGQPARVRKLRDQLTLRHPSTSVVTLVLGEKRGAPYGTHLASVKETRMAQGRAHRPWTRASPRDRQLHFCDAAGEALPQPARRLT